MSDERRVGASNSNARKVRFQGSEDKPEQWGNLGEGTSNSAREIKAMKKTSILSEADTIVNGARQETYGHPSDNHGCTAQMWSGYLSRKYGTKIVLDVRDVCWLNALQKISRDANQPKRDNLVDVAGYAANIEMDEERKKI